MRHLLHLLLLVLLITGRSFAQSPTESWIEGTLVSKTDSQPISGAMVGLRTADGKDTPFLTLTDEKGYFLLKAVPGAYHLGASFAQQSFLLRPSLELSAGHLQLGKLPLELTRELQAVIVRQKAPLIRYDGNKMIFGEAAFAYAQGGSVLDGIQLIPGLQLEGGNHLKLYGLSEVVLYIDGRKQRLSREAVLSLLQGMSLSDLESIELIREPGVEYGGETSPILNIKRKISREAGVKGFSSLGLTYQHLLSEQLSTRVDLHRGRAQSWIYYGLSDQRRLETTRYSTGYTDELRTSPRLIHQAGAGTDINLGKGNSLGTQILWSKTREDLRFSAGETNKLRGSNLYGTLYHSLQRGGFDLQTTGEVSLGSTELQRGLGSEGDTQDEDQFYRLHIASGIKLSNALRLSLGAEASHIRVLAKVPHELSLREWNFEGYARLGFRFSKFSGHAGFRIVGEDRHGDEGPALGKFYRNGSEGFLSALLSYTPARAHQVSLSYTSSYSRPSYRDLLGYKSTASALFARRGNTDLETSYTRSLALTYTYLRAAQLELSYVDTDQPIVEGLSQQAGRYSLRRLNLENSHYLRALLILPVPLIYRDELSWTASTYLAVQRQWDRGRVEEKDYRKTFTAYYIQHKHSLSLPASWYAELGVTYYSPLMYGLFDMQRQWWINASVSKRFGDFRVALSAHDLLNSNIARGSYPLIPAPSAFSFERDWHSPRVQLTVSYTWGRKSLKSKDGHKRGDDTRRRSTEADEGLSLSPAL